MLRNLANKFKKAGGGGLTAPITLADMPDIAESTILLRAAGAGTGKPIAGTPAQVRAILGAGTVVQDLHQNITTDFTAGVAIPLDDTAPLPSEMALYASQSITPTNAASLIVVDARLMAEVSNGQCFWAAVFIDSETTPKGVAYSTYIGSSEYSRADMMVSFVAGTTSAITVKIYVAMRVSATIYMGHCTGATGDLGNSLTNHLNVSEVLQ